MNRIVFSSLRRWAGRLMFRIGRGGFGLVLCLSSALAQDRPASPSEQYQALLKQFQGPSPAYYQSTNDAERQVVVARVDNATGRMLELVEKSPKESFALEALTYIVTQEYWLNTHSSRPGSGQQGRQARALVLLLRDHLQSDQLVETCKRVGFSFRQECETFLRAVLEKNPHRDVQGAACLRLAQFLADRAEKLELLKEQPVLSRRYEELFGRDYLESLRRQDRANILKEAESFYELASEKYNDVKLPYNETVGEVARTDLFEIRHLAVGKTAPDIAGPDQEDHPMKLSDNRGKVVLLYFWSEF